MSGEAENPYPGLDTTLSHADERLGVVALDMGLMTPPQIEACRLEVARRRVAGRTSGFSQVAMELGLVDRETMLRIEAEETRRRRLIGGYEIIDLIGSGSIATVYKALQVAMDREVALKILHPRLASDPVFVKAYIAEAQAVSRFHHPHIVQGIDVGESNGFYYFAHEHLSGGTLGGMLKKEGPLNENRALLYLRQTASALKHAWEAGVHHGDLNPGNLLLDSRDNLKLANLGVPRVARPKEGGESGSRPGFVRCGPEYAAPEQLDRPEIVNSRTDLYNLAATFYHLSFGRLPFAGETVDEIIARRRENPMPELEERGRFSRKYVQLLRDMLQVDPKLRPGNPDELERRLEKFHIAGIDEWSGLATRSARIVGRDAQSGRVMVRIPAMNPDGPGELPGISRRADLFRKARNILWFVLAAVAVVVVLVLFLGG